MMSDKKYLFNGKDISINVYVQIRTVVNVIMERTQKTFMEAVEIFYDSETYKQLQHTENGFLGRIARLYCRRIFPRKNE